MEIQWNEVTWYSKLAAIIFFVGVLPVLTFFMGMQYREVQVDIFEASTQTSNVVVQSNN